MNTFVDDSTRKFLSTLKFYELNSEGIDDEARLSLPRRGLTEFVAQVGKKSGLVLNFGCGAGADAAYLYKQGFKVVGLDLSPKLLELARKRVPGGFFFNLDFTDSFSCMWKQKCAGVVISESFIHFPRMRLFPTISHAYNALAPNGMLYLRVLEGNGEENIYSSGIGENAVPGSLFYQYHSEESLFKNLTSCKFDTTAVNRDYSGTTDDHPWIDFFARKISSQ